MKYKFKMLIAVFSLTLIFGVNAFSQKVDCTKMSDSDIVKQINAKIKTKYAGQMIHINVRVAYGVATLEGWVTNKNVKKEIEKWAKKTSCVKSVVNNLSLSIIGGCGPGTKQCGDICISDKETCNICRPTQQTPCP